MAKRDYLVWDFDGTLAHRIGRWSGCLCAIADRRGLSGVTVEHFRPLLKSGFPWHTPDVHHSHLCDADAWWSAMHPVFVRVFEGVGFPADADLLAHEVREAYCDLASWQLYDDAIETLRLLIDRGWRHVILSNHVPELDSIVVGLGLHPYVEAVFSSAVTGYEKPHPEVYRIVERALGERPRCMIGDNPVADYHGAQAVGIPAILVRTSDPGIDSCLPDLRGISQLIEKVAGSSNRGTQSEPEQC